MTASPAAPPSLAGLIYRMREPVDDILEEIRALAAAEGARLGGVVQRRHPRPGGGRNALIAREINGAWEIPILQFRGGGARGCKLDPHAITEIAARLEAGIDARTDLLIINRFGRAEAESQGLRGVFERAAALEIPLLVAVREDYRQPWQAFHGGMGTELPLDRAAVVGWWRAVARTGPRSEARAG
ncbi:DUF2478 domain-containing protein [Marivibrio halodurans]|uniref:DUF2478 domain-containing protein n=1 Tax=Marivibrio halodurans TaxID=2039722 RepID=A0A8J7V203_9PROT|nr:DUF2478 domain-containing protein [Marivibrio halodurans]MBP5858331.1 DUF2478 domain-containing protein [Marivibrio halodurans]